MEPASIPSSSKLFSVPEMAHRGEPSVVFPALATPSKDVTGSNTRPSPAPNTREERPGIPFRRTSEMDWIVPGSEPAPAISRRTSVGDRLQPTIGVARMEREKYAQKAQLTGYALNIAIGLQVVVGAFTTGLGALTTGRQSSIITSILGAFSTIIASYLARARGSNEPELSQSRCKDLEQFLRECEGFAMDHGYVYGDEYDETLLHFRRRLEELLGNTNASVG